MIVTVSPSTRRRTPLVALVSVSPEPSSERILTSASLVPVRQWADNSRFRLATNHAWQDCAAYLRNATASHYTPRERRARILLRWLDEGKEVRQNAFSCDAEGRVLPGDEAWEWWLDEMEGAATTQDLEKRVRRRSEEKR